MKRILICLCIIHIISISTFYVSARENIVKVAGDEGFPPYEFVDEDDLFKGFNVDLIKAIGLFTNLEFEFYPMKWEDAYSSIENGNADIIQGMKVTENRKKNFIFTNTLVQSTDSIYIRTETNDIKSISDLDNKLVAVDYGDSRDLELRKNQNMKLITFQNPEMALLALYNKEVDALIGNTLVISYFSNKHNIASKVEVVGNAFNRQNYAIAVAKNNEELQKKLNVGIKAVQESGTYDQLYRKWFGVPIADPVESFRLAIIVTVVSTSLLLIMAFAYNSVNARLKKIINEEVSKQKTALEKLRKYNKLQFMDQIVSSIAHEIRNPLTSIRLYAEQIPNKLDNPKFLAAMAEDIPPEIERIDALINEFLQYTVPCKPDQERIQLSYALEHVLSFLHMQINNIQIDINIEPTITIIFDKNHFRQILINALINSIDALENNPKPHIWISAIVDIETVELRISDNAGGVEEQVLRYIFDPFFTSKKTGNGLGLFIMRQMAEENGGSVLAKNENGGLTIYLRVIRG